MAGSSAVRALGQLVASLHALPIPEQLKACWSRLEPRRTLDRVRDDVFQLRSDVPSPYRALLEEFCERAARLDDFRSVPRGIIHSDLAWSNLVEIGEESVGLIDFEGAGVGPPVVDLVEVTTYLVAGPSGSGPLLLEHARAFYEGYRSRRQLTAEELAAFTPEHLYHQLYHLANALERDDYDFIDRMKTRLASWEAGVLDQIITIASGPS